MGMEVEEVGTKWSRTYKRIYLRIDLLRHLSPTRGNGLLAMVGRIKQEAAALVA